MNVDCSLMKGKRCILSYETKSYFVFILKGLWNEKIGCTKILLFERAFEVIKIGFYSSRVSQFSLEIFGFVWYVNKSTGLTLHFIMTYKYLCDYSLNHCKVCLFSASWYIHTYTWTVLSDFVRQPQWYFWFSQKSLCSVTYAVELFSYQTNPNISRLKWDARQL